MLLPQGGGVQFFAKSFTQPSAVLGEISSSQIEVLPIDQPVITESSFTQKLTEETELIPKKVVYEDDPEIEAGEEKVLEEGKDGKKIKIYKVTYTKSATSGVGFEDRQVASSAYSPEVYSKEIVSVETTPVTDKKILRGTKIVWKILDTADGPVRYWKKLRVWATHYDGGAGCMGCNGRGITAIGLRVTKGVIAVDPAIIKLGTQIYVPGYGKAVAGDTGGNITGNIIDLGFEDARTAGWSARFVDIYLL
ncbi:G5 domain-containing protein [Candidatus Daviesbacteria bacterium]|nr:G5 domain-containing protein [Candidatus Daviesbacteria bacterium]